MERKKPELIPLCHPISLDNVTVLLSLVDGGVEIEATCKINAKTGVEMEAMTAVSVWPRFMICANPLIKA